MRNYLAFSSALMISLNAWSQGTFTLSFDRPDLPFQLLQLYEDQGFRVVPLHSNAYFIVNQGGLRPEFGGEPLVLTTISGDPFNISSVNWNNFQNQSGGPDIYQIKAVHPDGTTNLLNISAVAGTQNLTSYDLANLKAAILGDFFLTTGSIYLTIHSLGVEVIPEPSPALLAAGGWLLLGIVGFSRKRKFFSVSPASTSTQPDAGTG